MSVKRLFLPFFAFLIFCLSASVTTYAADAKIDEFKEPKSIKALDTKAASLFSKGDWIGTRKYLSKYLEKR